MLGERSTKIDWANVNRFLGDGDTGIPLSVFADLKL
jgi:hypothetical protein